MLALQILSTAAFLAAIIVIARSRLRKQRQFWEVQGETGVAGRSRHYTERSFLDSAAGAKMDYRAFVKVKVNYFGINLPLNGQLALVVKGDTVEISHPSPVIRFLFRQNYRFRADEALLKLEEGPLWAWVVINRRPPARPSQIFVSKDGRNAEIWTMLVRAGMDSSGPSPSILPLGSNYLNDWSGQAVLETSCLSACSERSSASDGRA